MTLTQGRVAAVAAGMLGVFLFLTVATVDVPHAATDADLLAWWQQSANRWSGVFIRACASASRERCALAVVPHHLVDAGGPCRVSTCSAWSPRSTTCCSGSRAWPHWD